MHCNNHLQVLDTMVEYYHEHLHIGRYALHLSH